MQLQPPPNDMDYLIVRGGRKLKGAMKVSGSKNSALSLLFSSLLTDEYVEFKNVPDLEDIKTSSILLELSGKKIFTKGSEYNIKTISEARPEIPYELVRKMRASILMAGPLLARYGRVKISLPGGCAIGVRPIDIHLDGFAKLGAKIELESGYVKMSSHRRLRGGRIALKFPSVGATENLVMAASLAEGESVIDNVAREPEITDLCDALVSMGAIISGAGTNRIKITGVKKLVGITHRIIPDRIETATYLIAAAITKGKIAVQNSAPSHCRTVIEKLKESGMKIEIKNTTITAVWQRPLKPVDISTSVYPGFPTDIQAQWMALMSSIKGRSVMSETIFENRFLHVAELRRMGADLKVAGNKVFVNGVEKLSGAPVMVSDLRAGAALVLAGLAARGVTKISRIYHLDRGYENLEKKLSSLGADIKRHKYEN